MPGAPARLDVEGDDAGAEQVVARPEAAEEVNGRRVGRNVDEPSRRVGRHRRPRRDISGPLPGVVLPCLVAELPRSRNHVELPEVLPAPGVIGQDIAGDVLDAGLVVPLLVDVAHHDNAIHHDGGRRSREVPELAGDALLGIVRETGLRPGGPVLDEIRKHVDDPAPREAAQRHARPPVVEMLARLGVEGVQEERGRRVVDDPSPVHLAIGDALPVVVAHPPVVPRRVGLAVRPQRLPRRRVDRRDGAPLAGHREQDPIHIDWRRAEDVVHLGTKIVAPPHPRHLQLLEVAGIDLVQRRIPRMRGVAADIAPLAGRGAMLLRDGRELPGKEAEGARHAHPESQLPGCPVYTCVHRSALLLTTTPNSQLPRRSRRELGVGNWELPCVTCCWSLPACRS